MSTISLRKLTMDWVPIVLECNAAERRVRARKLFRARHAGLSNDTIRKLCGAVCYSLPYHRLSASKLATMAVAARRAARELDCTPMDQRTYDAAGNVCHQTESAYAYYTDSRYYFAIARYKWMRE